MARVGEFFRGDFSESSSSFSKEDFVQMTVLSHFYGTLCSVKFLYKQYHDSFDVDHIVAEFLKSEIYAKLKQNLLDNWRQDKFYYTIDFSGAPATVSACYATETIDSWLNSINFKKFILLQNKNRSFRKEYLHLMSETVYESKNRYRLIRRQQYDLAN
jgi:hypothetical protein